MANCNNCGHELKQETKFCDNCGASVIAAQQAQGGTAQVPPQGIPQPPMQQPPMQQPPMQQPMQMQNQPAQGGVTTATKKPNNNLIIFIGIGVAAIVVIVLLIVLISSLFSGSSEDEPHVGLWTATEIAVEGMTMQAEEMFPDGITMELKSNNDCVLSYAGTDYDAEYEISGSTLTLKQDGEEFPGTLEGNTLTITNILNMGVDIIFTKDGQAGIPTTEGSDTAGTDSVGSFIAPGYGAEQTVPSETLEFPSSWYGIVTISDYVGSNDISGEYEAWAYLDEDDNGSYFELYVHGNRDNPDSALIMTFNVDVHDYTFFPIEDEYAALIDGAPYVEEGENSLIPTMLNGTLQATYNYDYIGNSFTISYNIAKISSGGVSAEAGTGTETQPETNTSTPSSATQLTMAELRIVFDNLKTVDKELLYPLSIEELSAQYFYGVAPEIDSETEEYIAYVWVSVEDRRSMVHVTYKPNESTGEFEYSHATGSDLP